MKNRSFTFILTLIAVGIFMPAYSVNFYQDIKADFIYATDNMRNVTFTNQSAGNITKYEWGFGDNTFTEKENPEHRFNKNGDFQVCLTIYDEDNSQDSHCELIHIEGLNIVSGLIYAGPNILEEGKIFLIENSKSNFVISASVDINAGEFTFDAVPNGNYTLYAVPNLDYSFHYFPKYIATYSGGAVKWDNSKSINLRENTITENISLKSYDEIFYGHSSIKGSFKFQENNLLDGIPINVILLNNNKQPMDFRSIDSETGEYAFEELPYGRYYIHPEIAGFHSSDFEIELTSENNARTNINFNLDDNDNIVLENNPDNKIYDIDITFNLERGNIYIRTDKKIEEAVTCELFDVTGRLILNSYETPPEINIDASYINPGLYILSVKTFTNKNIGTQKIFINK